MALTYSDPRKLFKWQIKLSLLQIKNLPHFTEHVNFQLWSIFYKFFENKITSVNIMIRTSTPPIYNSTTYITHPIDSLSLLTISSPYYLSK